MTRPTSGTIHQIPNTKLQRNPGIEAPKTKLQTPKKSQVPNSKPQAALRAWNLELGAWSFSGVWCLELQSAEGFPPLSPLGRLNRIVPLGVRDHHAVGGLRQPKNARVESELPKTKRPIGCLRLSRALVYR